MESREKRKKTIIAEICRGRRVEEKDRGTGGVGRGCIDTGTHGPFREERNMALLLRVGFWDWEKERAQAEACATKDAGKMPAPQRKSPGFSGA